MDIKLDKKTLARWERLAKAADARENLWFGFNTIPSRTALVDIVTKLVKEKKVKS